VRPSRMNDRRLAENPREGFTLLEVLVSLTILAVAVTWSILLFSANLRTISLSDDYMPMAVLAEMKMRDVLNNEVLEEKMWSETADDACRIDISVSETLKERTESLGIRLLEVSVKVQRPVGLKKKTLTLRTLKAVKKVRS